PAVRRRLRSPQNSREDGYFDVIATKREEMPPTTNGLRSEVPHVVIVGGGFGGLYAAKGLARAPVRVTLIDKHSYHMFRPLMYQVATGLLTADDVAPPLRAVFRLQRNVNVLMGEVSGIDTQRRVVHSDSCDIPYDYLIVATGIRSNYFGNDAWKAFAPALDSLDDAATIRGNILGAFEKAERLATCSG